MITEIINEKAKRRKKYNIYLKRLYMAHKKKKIGKRDYNKLIKELDEICELFEKVL